jgi:gliding motility-associated lipoprotein GldH
MMLRKYGNHLLRNHVFGYTLICLILLLGHSCTNLNTKELYHPFPDKNWARFNLLSFEIPVENIEKPYDVYLFARFNTGFQYNTLDFNMIMNTSAGEERIHEYQMVIRSKSGRLLLDCKNDSCTGTILLKRELYLSKSGILKIEIENLTPRMLTEGVIGVGIKMVESGKEF